MGWVGGHLHAFRMRDPKDPDNQRSYIEFQANPDSDFDTGQKIFKDHKGKVKDYCIEYKGKRIGVYEYDFGDGWEHKIEYEGKVPALKELKEYPILVAGKNQCPPENCGGPRGFAELKEILADPTHEDYEDKRFEAA